MNTLRFTSLNACTRYAGLALLVSVSLLLTGCGMGVQDTSSVVKLNLKGVAFGGQQPVIGATMGLYAVALPTSGGSYGMGQRSMLTTTVQTVAGGSFSITGDYTCNTGDYVYLTAIGGNPGANGNNSAAALLVALGPCSNLNSDTFITINEATTVAGVFALQQFASVTWGTANTLVIGAPSSNVLGLQNAFAAVGNLVNNTSGTIPASTTRSATLNGSTASLIATNEASKVGHLANMLAYCVNSVDITTPSASISTNCSTLFNSLTFNGHTPGDTIQAALAFAMNPTNVGNGSTPPFDLVSSSPPFTGLATNAVPTDWTLGLSFSSASLLGTAPTQNFFLEKNYSMAIDSVGNIWVICAPGGSTVTPFYNSVAEISPAGLPLASVLTGTALNTPRGIAIDNSDNVWIVNNAATTAGAIVEYTAGATNTFNYTNGGLYGVAIDRDDNVIMTTNSSDKLAELVAGSAPGSSAANIANVGSSAEALAIDANNGVWSSNLGSNSVSYFKATCTATPCTYTTAATATIGAVASSFGIAIDENNLAWAANQIASGSLSKVDPVNGATTSIGGLGGLATPNYAALDGSGNFWSANSTGASVSEIASGSTTVALSGTTGFKHTFSSPRGIGIDASGNVWVSNLNGATSTSNPGLTEIVGAASPAVTPLAKAVKMKKLGQLP